MTYPSAPILDDFNRANGPPGADWGNPFSLPPGLPSIISNRLGTTSVDGKAAYWTHVLPNDLEVYYDTYFTKPNSFTEFRLHFRMFDGADGTGWGGTTNPDYFVDVTYTAPGTTTIILYRYDNSGGPVALDTVSQADFDSGSSLGISAIGSALKVYHKAPAGSWTQIISVTDTAVATGGYAAIEIYPEINGKTVAIDNFGGGAPTAPSAPVADFSGTPTSGEQTLAVTFTDASTNTPTSWLWDFGDGSTSTAQNPSHNYPLQGVYTVSLTATNAIGSNTNTKIDYITVALAAPSGLTAVAKSASRIHLTWTDNSTGEIGFKIERKDSGAYAQIATVSENVTEYMDSGLTPSTLYTYRVRAYN